MANNNKTRYIFLILVSCFLISGCVSLKEIDSQIGKVIEYTEPEGVVTKDKQDGSSEVIELVDPQSLSKEAKEKIDVWLNDNGYNRYGDPVDTFYTGGTPLFDEASGEAIERFEYIIKKHPDIMDKINK